MFCIEELFPQFFSETWNYFLDFGFTARNLLIIMDFVVCVVLRRPAHRRSRFRCVAEKERRNRYSHGHRPW